MQRKQTITLVAGVGLLLALALVLTACGSGSTAPTSASDDTALPALRTPSASTPRSPAINQQVAVQSTPVPQSTPENAIVTVWWPDELYPEDATTENILTNQFDLFALTYTNYGIDVRRKRSSGLGGILSTLRTAAPVAPWRAAGPDADAAQ